MTSEARVVCLGEPLVAFVGASSGPMRGQNDFEAHVVGAELNVAVGLARLGVPSALVGRCGADPLGEMIRRVLRSECVDTTLLVTDEFATSGTLIRDRQSVSPSSVVYHRRESAGSKLCVADVDAAADMIRHAEVLHVSGITAAISESARDSLVHAISIARTAGVLVSLDLNHRRKLWTDESAIKTLAPVMALSDIAFATIDEASLFSGGVPSDAPATHLARLCDMGPTTAIVKLGPSGASAMSGDKVASVPGVPVVELDAVGAGDAFAAGYLAGMLTSHDMATCLRWGAAVGAACVSAIGDLTGLPNTNELAAILSSQGQPIDR
jgi:2-dehydro-3-deoxygluconokinase